MNKRVFPAPCLCLWLGAAGSAPRAAAAAEREAERGVGRVSRASAPLGVLPALLQHSDETISLLILRQEFSATKFELKMQTQGKVQ